MTQPRLFPVERIPTGHLKGHPIYLDPEDPRILAFEDGHRVDEGNPRPCAACGLDPTPEGYDACLGFIPGSIGACCGHGSADAYVAFEDGRVYYGSGAAIKQLVATGIADPALLALGVG